MKSIRLILIGAAFMVMLAAIVNYSMIIGEGTSKMGVYLELVAIGLIAVAVSILGYKEKRKQ